MKRLLEKKVPAYSWVGTDSGKVLVLTATTMELLEHLYDDFFFRWNLSQTKFNALLLLYMNQEMALWELGEEMLVSRANITGLMDRLEKEGLVTRKVNSADRRSLTASLTEKSHALVEEILPLFRQYTEELMNVLTQEEKQTLIKLLTKLQQGAGRMK